MFTRASVLSLLEVGDYFYGRDGKVIWKVIAKREDGHYGIVNGEGKKVIVKPEHTTAVVAKVMYGFDSEDEMEAAAVAAVKEAMPGSAVIARGGPGEWVMPSLDELYDDVIALKAHLLVHHEYRAGQDLLGGDLAVIHHDLHGEADPGHGHTDA